MDKHEGANSFQKLNVILIIVLAVATSYGSYSALAVNRGSNFPFWIVFIVAIGGIIYLFASRDGKGGGDGK